MPQDGRADLEQRVKVLEEAVSDMLSLLGTIVSAQRGHAQHLTESVAEIYATLSASSKPSPPVTPGVSE